MQLEDARVELACELRHDWRPVEAGGDDDRIGLEPLVAAVDDVPVAVLGESPDTTSGPDG